MYASLSSFISLNLAERLSNLSSLADQPSYPRQRMKGNVSRIGLRHRQIPYIKHLDRGTSPGYDVQKAWQSSISLVAPLARALSTSHSFYALARKDSLQRRYLHLLPYGLGAPQIVFGLLLGIKSRILGGSRTPLVEFHIRR